MGNDTKIWDLFWGGDNKLLSIFGRRGETPWNARTMGQT